MSSTVPEESHRALRSLIEPLELVVSSRRRSRVALRRFSRACAALVTLVVLAVAVPAAFGVSHSTMTDDSMGESLGRGSVVFTVARPVMDLEVGDVITYRLPPGDDGAQGPQVIRRIADIKAGEIWTSSDRTGAIDPWTIESGKAMQECAVVDVPYLGYLYDASSDGADLVRRAFSSLH